MAILIRSSKNVWFNIFGKYQDETSWSGGFTCQISLKYLLQADQFITIQDSYLSEAVLKLCINVMSSYFFSWSANFYNLWNKVTVNCEKVSRRSVFLECFNHSLDPAKSVGGVFGYVFRNRSVNTEIHQKNVKGLKFVAVFLSLLYKSCDFINKL